MCKEAGTVSMANLGGKGGPWCAHMHSVLKLATHTHAHERTYIIFALFCVASLKRVMQWISRKQTNKQRSVE